MSVGIVVRTIGRRRREREVEDEWMIMLLVQSLQTCGAHSVGGILSKGPKQERVWAMKTLYFEGRCGMDAH
jgi:hypothetical protein